MIYALIEFIIYAPPLFAAIILHEVAHGWAAEKLGDPTARERGRITLNPLAHIDPFMTIILPGVLLLANSKFLFGGAKPVPVNPMNFKNPRRGMAYVAMAGPLLNFSLALTCLPIFHALRFYTLAHPATFFGVKLLKVWMLHSVFINVVLGLFNLLPVPPLDGGRILVGFLPIRLARVWARLEPFGLFIVIFLMLTGGVQRVLSPILLGLDQYLIRIQ